MLVRIIWLFHFPVSHFWFLWDTTQQVHFAQSAGAVEYTDCFSAVGKTPPAMSVLIMTLKSDDETPVILELWGICSTSSLPLLPGPLWFGMVAPDEGPIDGLNRTKPFLLFLAFKRRIYAELNCSK